MTKDLREYRDQHESIRAEFAKQAEGWGGETLSPDLLWAVDRLPLQPHFAVLDVAAGTGLLGRAIAPRVESVVAVDITPEMLSEGRRQAERERISNIRFEPGAAEALPYDSESFDMVGTRFSLHHFQNPEAAIREMARVCRPGGHVGVIDIVSPEDEELAARYNHFERLRDPSHTRALRGSELTRTIEAGGFRITRTDRRDVRNGLSEWFDRARTGDAARDEILQSLRRELEGGAPTGFRPFADGPRVMFLHTWEVVVGTKP